MSGRPAFERSSYRADIKILRAQGMTFAQVAQELGMSRDTVYRILRGR